MPQMIFFLKISNTTSMYLLAQSRVMRMCHFRVQNDQFVLNKIFLVQTIITFIYLLALFIVQNLKTFLLRPRVMRICHFRTQNSQLTPPKKHFFGTTHYYYFHLPIGPFHCAKFKILTLDPGLWGCTNFGPKMVHLPQTSFFGKLLISFSSTY